MHDSAQPRSLVATKILVLSTSNKGTYIDVFVQASVCIDGSMFKKEGFGMWDIRLIVV